MGEDINEMNGNCLIFLNEFLIINMDLCWYLVILEIKSSEKRWHSYKEKIYHVNCLHDCQFPGDIFRDLTCDLSKDGSQFDPIKWIWENLINSSNLIQLDDFQERPRSIFFHLFINLFWIMINHTSESLKAHQPC